MKLFMLSAVIPFFMGTLFLIPINYSLSTERPETTIVTIIDDNTKVAQEFDDGYDCTIFLDAEGKFVAMHGADC